jgi:hypothetical protein
MLVSCLTYSSTLKTEALYSSETLVNIQLGTRRCISENITLHVVTFHGKVILRNIHNYSFLKMDATNSSETLVCIYKII